MTNPRDGGEELDPQRPMHEKLDPALRDKPNGGVNPTDVGEGHKPTEPVEQDTPRD